LRIHQSTHFSSSLKQDVIKDFKSLVKDQNQKSKILISEGKKIDKDMKNFTESLEKVPPFPFTSKKNNFYL